MSEFPKIEKEFADYYIKKMSLYIDNAKMYIQIAIGSLILPITFYKELFGIKDGERVDTDNWLIVSWILLLIAIGAGLFYQYFAVKRIETRLEHLKPRYLDEKPGIVYFIMGVFFYAGIISFVISACCRLKV